MLSDYRRATVDQLTIQMKQGEGGYASVREKISANLAASHNPQQIDGDSTNAIYWASVDEAGIF